MKKISSRYEESTFFILISTGIFIAWLAWNHLPPSFPVIAKIPIIWMILSMGLFWAIDRILHALGGIAGETERDGVIWLIPIAWGWIPIVWRWILEIFLTNKLSSSEYLFSSIVIYCSISYTVVTVCRPEISDIYEPYLKEIGLYSWKNPFQLFKYKMDVAKGIKFGPVMKIKFRFFSLSYLFYTICFGLTAFVTSTKAISTVPAYPIALGAAVLVGTMTLISQVFKAKEEDVLWRMQAKEGYILSLLFGLSAFNIYMFLLFMLVV
jgi:hypothetical protein